MHLSHVLLTGTSTLDCITHDVTESPDGLSTVSELILQIIESLVQTVSFSGVQTLFVLALANLCLQLCDLGVFSV